ncbi:MAG: hypothetical protein VKK98_03750 [Cyanobacteriota bacterium]|nr:hypothetical protein [Cyanobacteriota bacterium]
MSSDRRRALQLATGSSRSRRVFRRQKRVNRFAQLSTGVLLISSGAGILVGLLQLPERLDTLLLVSNAIANLIGGAMRFGTGLLQLLAVLALVAVALAALVLLVAGLVRLGKAVMFPGSR